MSPFDHEIGMLLRPAQTQSRSYDLGLLVPVSSWSFVNRESCLARAVVASVKQQHLCRATWQRAPGTRAVVVALMRASGRGPRRG